MKSRLSRRTKQNISTIFELLMIVAIFYLLTSFVLGDMNPFDWSKITRLFFSAITLMVCVFHLFDSNIYED